MNPRTRSAGSEHTSRMRQSTVTHHARSLRRVFASTAAALTSLAAILVSPALAQTAPATLRVETLVVPPFVMERGDTLTGFSVDLWEGVAARLNVKTSYEKAPDISAGIEAMRSGKIDIAVSAILVTVERDKEFDFSYAILEAGQQVMVRDTGESGFPNPLLDLYNLLFSKTSLVWLGIATLFMLIPAHVVWLLERRRTDGVISDPRYFPGIFQAIYWSATTLLTQGQQTPQQPLARAIGFVLMFAGIVFVALYTAQLTTNLTVQHIRGAINGPEDLPGKQVGTLAGSISAEYLREHNARVREFAQVGDMFQALLDKKVDAVLLGAPVLRYYAAHEGAGLVRTVGPEFQKRDIGFLFPADSPLRKPVNSALVAMHEDGTYDRIYQKWFGKEQ